MFYVLFREEHQEKTSLRYFIATGEEEFSDLFFPVHFKNVSSSFFPLSERVFLYIFLIYWRLGLKRTEPSRISKVSLFFFFFFFFIYFCFKYKLSLSSLSRYIKCLNLIHCLSNKLKLVNELFDCLSFPPYN